MRNRMQNGLMGFLVWSCALSLNTETGSLSHYRVNDEVDYWVWQESPWRVETLFDASELGTDESARWRDVWTIAPSGNQFDRHSRHNLRPGVGQPTQDQEAWFDQQAGLLRTVTGGSSFEEPMPFQPMLWQRDLGIYFTVFFPHLPRESLPVTLCLDSYGHLIWLLAKPEGEELVGGIRCLRWNVAGRGLWSNLMHRATIWTAIEGPARLVRMQQDLAFSWTLPRMRLELVETRDANHSDWLQLQQQERLTSSKEILE